MSRTTALLCTAVVLSVVAAAGDLAERAFVPAAAVLCAMALGLAVLVARGRRLRGAGLARWTVAGYVIWAAVRLASAGISAEADSPTRVIADIVSFGWLHRGSPDSGWARAIPLALALAALAPVLGERWRGRHPAGLDALGALSLAAAVLWVPTAVEVISREYVERISTVDQRRIYVGPLLPLSGWSLLTAVALGVITVAIFRPLLVHHGLVDRGRLAFTGWAAGIAATAFVWRLFALLAIAPSRTDGGDPLYYHTQANTIARGLGFIEPLNWIAEGTRVPTALHGPGFPLYLSLFSRVGANTWFDHRLAASLIGTATVVVAMLLARRLGGDLAAVLAGLAATFYPHLWTIDGVLFPEGLFIFLCGLVMLFAYRWYDHRRWLDAALTGAAIGAAALTRGEGVFLVVLLSAPLIWFAGNLSRRRRLAHLAVVFAAALAVMAPWMVRNALTFEDFVPLSTNGNELHVYSNCEMTYGGEFLGFWHFDCQQKIRDPDGDGVTNFEPGGDESQKAKYWQDVGFDYAREHVAELPKVVAARVLRQWDLFRPLQNAQFALIEGRSIGWAQVGLVAYFGLVVASAFAVRRLWRGDRRLLIPLAAQFVAVTLTAAYAYGTTRFRAPADLALCVLAGVGVAPLARRVISVLARPLRRDQPASGALPALSRLDRLGWTVPYLPALAMIGVAAPGMFRHPGASMEEGFMLVFPERVLDGDVPHVDFLHLYGPGSLHLLAGVYALFGVSLDVARTVGLIYDVAAVAAIITLARHWGRLVAAVAGILGVLVVFTAVGLTPLAWNGAIALGLWSLVSALHGGRRSMLGAALLAGLAISFRPDLVLTLGLAHGVRWWVDRRAWRAADRPRSNPWAVAGAFAVGSVSFVVLFVQAGLRAPIRGMFVEPVFLLRPGRELPRPPSWTQLDGLLQFIAEHPAPAWPLPAMTAPQQLYIWFFVILGLDVALAWAAVRWWRRPDEAVDPHRRRARILVVIAAANFGLLAQALQRPDSTHLLWGSTLALPLGLCWVAEWRRRSPGPDRLGTRLAVSALPLILLVAVLPFFTVRTYAMHVRQTLGPGRGGLPPGLVASNGDRSFLFGDLPPWSATQQIIDDLSAMAEPGERLLVGPVDLRATPYSDAYFYYLFPDLDPATRFIEMDPGLANADDSGLADEVASADWLILTRFWSEWAEPNTSREYRSDEPNQVVERQFCLVGSYEHDRARLYRRCPEGGAPGPYAGPYEPDFDYAVIFGVTIPPRPDGSSPSTPRP